MKTALSVTETARNFSDILNRVAYRGERFILLKGNRPVAEISPIKTGRPVSELPGILEKLPSLTAGEARSFAGDLDKIREEAGKADRLCDPWES